MARFQVEEVTLKTNIHNPITMKTPQTMKEKIVALLAIIVAVGILTGGVYAAAAIPTELESQYIQLGRLMERKDMLHEQADVKRAEIESLKQEWYVIDRAEKDLRTELFQ